MTSPTYRTCRLRAVRTSGHRCEAVRGGGTVPDARGMVGRGGPARTWRGARLFTPTPCDPTGGGVKTAYRKPVPAGLLLAGPAPARACLWSPLLKRTLLAWPHEGCADRTAAARDGQAGYLRYGQEQSGQRRHAQRRCSLTCTFERICSHQSSSHSTATTRCVRPRPNLCRS
jgi:hypothetical protein